MSRKSELEYIEETKGFSIENITKSNFDLFSKIHCTIYDGIKSEVQLESELDYMERRLETGTWKVTELYPEADEFTEEMFYDMVEEYKED